MKTFLTLLCSSLMMPVFAQDVTTVNATSERIGDNLDLRAVASIFADSNNLEDFERRINNPENRINNLDLNFDGRVDYLRVIETVENFTHLIVIQAVLDRDVYQDVATIDVQRNGNDNVQVQFVGDVFMYGPNYIYEPVFVHTPVIYRSFWAPRYVAYCSPFYWNFYPPFYTYWAPYPVYTYRNNVNVFINVNHQYNYVNTRRNTRAIALYDGRRANGYERYYSTRGNSRFENNGRNSYGTTRNSTSGRGTTTRNSDVNNTQTGGTRNSTAVSSDGVRPSRNTGTSTQTTRNTSNPGVVRESGNTRNEAIRTTPSSNTTRSSSVQSVPNTSVNTTRGNGTRSTQTVNQGNTGRTNTSAGTTRGTSVRASQPTSGNTVRTQSTNTRSSSATPRQSTPVRQPAVRSTNAGGDGGRSSDNRRG